jgi:hypothetical protein
MKQKKELGLYLTNKRIRGSIDKMLKQNACNVANSGTGSRLDIGGDSEVQSAWLELQSKIEQLDPIFYNSIKSQDE